jgi:hypothetical protein
MSDSPINHHAFGFFDESGKLSSSEIVVFGGFVALGNSLMEFGPKWTNRLQQDGLSYISMKEAVNWRGPFESWSNLPERRDRLLADLASLVCAAPLMRMASYMTTAKFKALPEPDRKIYGDPQYCCFEACILGCLQGRSDFSLNITCDLSEEYSEKCVKLFHKLRARNPVIRARCPGISFLDDRSFMALQVADMIAYCARAERLPDRSRELPVVSRLIELFASQDRQYGELNYRVGSMGLGYGEIE